MTSEGALEMENQTELLETCAVSISIGGTMAAGETTRVVQFLDEKGLV
jgi:hypothetical protein